MEGAPILAARPRFSGRDVLNTVLLLGLAGLFLFSGIAKLLTLQDFIWTLSDTGLRNRAAAEVAARALVGLEVALGAGLVLRAGLKRCVLPVSAMLLVLFSGYLGYLLLRDGPGGDCGCMGALFRMAPEWALVRNVAMLAAVAWLMRQRIPTARILKTVGWIVMVLSVAAAALWPYTAEKPRRLDFSALYAEDSSTPPRQNLASGTHLVAFFSLGCEHCRDAAKILTRIHAEDATLPVFVVLGGPASMLPDFLGETRSVDVPHTLLQNSEAFQKLAGPYVPAIYVVEDCVAVRKVSRSDLSAPAIRRWTRR